jgi:hypothetical protein
MPAALDLMVRLKHASDEHREMLRAAYISALAELALQTAGDRLALLEILQEIADTEVFRNAHDVAALAVDLYRARRLR